MIQEPSPLDRARDLVAALGPSVVGAWVIGSLADGTYQPGQSDLDLLVVADGTHDVALPDDVDLGVLTLDEAARGGDGTNALRVLAARRTALEIVGGPAVAALGAPREAAVRETATADLDQVLEHELTAEGWVSGVLRACRDLATLTTPLGTVIGRAEAGAWALERLPHDHRPVVAAALAARAAGGNAPAPDPEALRRFRTFVVGAAVPRRLGRKVAGLP